MNVYSAFPKAPAILKPHHQIVYCHIQRTRLHEVLPISRDAIGEFFSLSRKGYTETREIFENRLQSLVVRAEMR